MPRGTSTSIKSFYGGTTRSREACLKCSLLEKKITGDSARTAVLYIYYYIYPRIVVIVSFHFEIKSRLVLLLFLNGKVVVWLFFSSFPKNDVSPEKRESSVVFSFGLSFPERKKEKKRPFKNFLSERFFFPSSSFIIPGGRTFTKKKKKKRDDPTWVVTPRGY